MNAAETKARKVSPAYRPSGYVQLRTYGGEELFSVAFGEEGQEQDFRVAGFLTLSSAQEFFGRWMSRRVGPHFDTVTL